MFCTSVQQLKFTGYLDVSIHNSCVFTLFGLASSPSFLIWTAKVHRILDWILHFTAFHFHQEGENFTLGLTCFLVSTHDIYSLSRASLSCLSSQSSQSMLQAWGM